MLRTNLEHRETLRVDTTLAITLTTLVLCTQRASERASRYARCASWFWVPFTVVLFAMQVSQSTGGLPNSKNCFWVLGVIWPSHSPPGYVT